MAILALISAYNVKDGLQYLDDVVGVFADDHVFTPLELERFNFMKLNGTVEDVNIVLKSITPRTAMAYIGTNGDLTFVEVPNTKQVKVWQPIGTRKWYRLVNEFKFPYNVGELTPEEKQLAETYDITHPSVGSFINKVVKSIEADPANNVEVVELKNTEPLY